MVLPHSARLANLKLGGAEPSSAPHSSPFANASSNADNAASADLGLIGLAVM